MVSFGRRLARVFTFVFIVATSAACGTTSHNMAGGETRLAFVAEPTQTATRDAGATPPLSFGGLAGRTVTVDSVSDLRLRKHEVALTFDDGPVPGRTHAVLDALDKAGVKATFLMVGQMAHAYPRLVREVAMRGHTIGTHTQSHANLTQVSTPNAEAQINSGMKNVSDALVPTRYRAAPFFRFPYLASTPRQRRQLAARGITVIDADIDSKDYFQSSTEQLRQRTLARVEARGSGIILMHDIHARTGKMLPALLADLKERGYKVVRLVPGGRAENLLVSSLTHNMSAGYPAPKTMRN
ncbi:polysaccharide deacetylase family protein [Mesorhizobium sp. 1M-11]|uniref:polysaccharide deacetylase family protein n=1 Tax=Mesorhizobium sp. 1M-11 TaxID=1529006 RepID=UPI0006C73785|nr:polysaccharide deacetylase family protein [Mesorhizobium sp. 1M-11]